MSSCKPNRRPRLAEALLARATTSVPQELSQSSSELHNSPRYATDPPAQPLVTPDQLSAERTAAQHSKVSLLPLSYQLG